MDSRGWIPIQLLADFKRVRQLTNDPHLVKDVLILSRQVEVKDDHVRMLQWAQFVLPTAPPSVVEVIDSRDEGDTSGGAAAATEQDEGEEEEEEVVFVLERPEV